MKNILLYTLSGILLLGCSDRHEGSDSVELVKKIEVTTLLVAKLSRWGIPGTDGFVKRGNTVVVRNITDEGYAVSFDLREENRYNFFKRDVSSREPVRELSSFNSSDGKTVTALDFRTGELIGKAIPGLARSENTETVIPLPPGQQHLIAVQAGSLVIATGLYDEGRYLLYSLSDGSARYFLSYPSHPVYPDLREETKAMLHASNVLRARPDGQAFVCADMYSGMIDFCRVSPAGIERMRTVCLHHPRVKITETPRPRVQYYRNNRLGFTDVTVTDDRVYALYSGKSHEEAGYRMTECETLLEYDWEGNLLKSCALDVSLVNVSYDAVEQVVYGITTEGALIKLD